MSNRIEGERVFCYQCEYEWDRAHGGLECPQCHSEFVEIVSNHQQVEDVANMRQLETGRRPDVDDPPEAVPESQDSPFRALRDHNPWNVPDPDEGDIRTIHFNPGSGGHGSFSFTRTYTLGGPHTFRSGQDPAADEVIRNFEMMVSNILGGPARNTMFGGTININGRTTTFGSGTRNTGFGGPPEYNPSDDDTDMADLNSPVAMLFGGPHGVAARGGPFGFLNLLIDHANARSGDAVYSQEAFDRIMSQLMEQNQQNGAPPASQDLIDQLPRKNIDKSMAGDDGKAECSICMDNVDIGTEVTVLPCNHWFHFECIESWLKEHDTCPHCRKPITPEDQRQQDRRPRRSSRRSSSVATPFTQMNREASHSNPRVMPDSPSAVRAAREQYYGRSRQESEQRSENEGRSTRRSASSQDGGGGVSGWIRSRLPFSS